MSRERNFYLERITKNVKNIKRSIFTIIELLNEITNFNFNEFFQCQNSFTWNIQKSLEIRKTSSNKQHCTKMKFSIKDFFGKCDQIRSFRRIWSHLLKKSLVESIIFCAVQCFCAVFSGAIVAFRNNCVRLQLCQT